MGIMSIEKKSAVLRKEGTRISASTLRPNTKVMNIKNLSREW